MRDIPITPLENCCAPPHYDNDRRKSQGGSRWHIGLFGCDSNRSAAGSDSFNWVDILATLHAVGYDGWLSMEFMQKPETSDYAAACLHGREGLPNQLGSMRHEGERVLIGVIADDFTGASDIASTFALGGMRTVLTIGQPRTDRDYGSPDVLVVALKTRSIAPAEAVAQSLAALQALQARGARPIFLKYCSTFDSTAAGNIGPVADALLDRLGAPLTIHCPALPTNGRRVFGGYLFVGDVLLSETGMREHPITPMRDANLLRVLQAQTPSRVARIDFETVHQGRAAIARAIREAAHDGIRHAIVDAANDEDLRALSAAAMDAELPLIAGGSGVALGVPEVYRQHGWLGRRGIADELPPTFGSAAILAGSCSRTTRAQIAYAHERLPVFDLSERSFDEPGECVAEALAWADATIAERPILIVASDTPQRVAKNQLRYGAEEASAHVEAVLAEIARGLLKRGVRRLVVAGGETSGAVVEGTGCRRASYWTTDRSGRSLDRDVQRPADRACAEIGQLRRRGLLPARLHLPEATA